MIIKVKVVIKVASSYRSYLIKASFLTSSYLVVFIITFLVIVVMVLEDLTSFLTSY